MGKDPWFWELFRWNHDFGSLRYHFFFFYGKVKQYLALAVSWMSQRKPMAWNLHLILHTWCGNHHHPKKRKRQHQLPVQKPISSNTKFKCINWWVSAINSSTWTRNISKTTPFTTWKHDMFFSQHSPSSKIHSRKSNNPAWPQATFFFSF